MDQHSSQFPNTTSTSMGASGHSGDLRTTTNFDNIQRTSSTQAQNGSVYSANTFYSQSSVHGPQSQHANFQQPSSPTPTQPSSTGYYGQPHVLGQPAAWGPWPGNSPLLTHNSHTTNPAEIEAARIARTKAELDRIHPHLPRGQ